MSDDFGKTEVIKRGQVSPARHSAGPWEIGTPNGFNANHVYASGDKSVAMVYGISMYTTKQEAEESTMCAEGMANARLIAAAPEMLAALKECLQNTGGGWIAASVIERAEAVIAKATGATTGSAA